MDFIAEVFEQADITPAELRDDPSHIERLVEFGMRLSHGQANPHILEYELKQRAENA